jgi:HTH-type transcriptional regulator/antitoxin HipB
MSLAATFWARRRMMMSIQNQRQLGAALRERRNEMGLTQHELGRKVGVTRDWVIGVEAGSANPQLKHLLRALDVLDLQLSIDETHDLPSGFDLDVFLGQQRQRGLGG